MARTSMSCSTRPTSEWASRRNAPTIDLYLYDIREAMHFRQEGQIDIRDDAGHIEARRRPARMFRLSYLLTAWTQRPEDEHRLLSAALGCFLVFDVIPMDVLVGTFAGSEFPIEVSVARPPPQDRAISDIWSALGGELKPSLDLVVTAPMAVGPVVPAAGLVLEAPKFTVAPPTGSAEVKQKTRSKEGASAPSVTPDKVAEDDRTDLPDETVYGGTESSPGRTVRVRALPRRS